MYKCYKYPYKPEKKKIGKTEIFILGVEHTPEFFGLHIDFFKKIVNKNNAIILEQTINQNFWECDFFGEIANLNTSKKIYQVDSINLLTDELGSGLGSLGILLAFYASFKLGWNIADKKVKNEKINRRKFITKLLQIGAGFSLYFGSENGAEKIENVFPETGMTYGLDDFLFYGDFDYRNIKMAEGIEKICKEKNAPKKIAVIHGAAHSDPILKYLKYPKLRTKKMLYFPFSLIGKTKIREYKISKYGCKWNLIREF